MTAGEIAIDPEARAPHPRRWWAMIVLVVALMLDLLNATIVTVGLPAIARDLQADAAQVEWISAVYLLAFAAALITTARAGDVWGRRRMLLVGLVVFAAAGIWCGLAQSAGELIAARAVQGLAAAAVAPQVISVLYTIFEGRERATVMGATGIVAGFAQAGGLVLGGLLVTADVAGLGWRTIFFCTVPIALAAIAALPVVPESRVAGAMRPQPLPAAVLSLGLVAIVFPLLEGRTYQWPAWCWACLVAGVLVLFGLATVQHRRPARRSAALLPVALLRLRAVAVALVVLLAAFAGFSGFLLVFALWLQDGQGYSPLAAGMITLAFSAGSLLTAVFTGRLTERFGRLVVMAGCGLGAVGALAVLASSGADVVGPWSLVPGLFLIGAGINLTMPALVTGYLGAVPPELVGSASGVLSTTQQFGGAIGVAALGAIFFAGVADSYRAGITAGLVATTVLLLAAAALCLAIPAPGKRRNVVR